RRSNLGVLFDDSGEQFRLTFTHHSIHILAQNQHSCKVSANNKNSTLKTRSFVYCLHKPLFSSGSKVIIAPYVPVAGGELVFILAPNVWLVVTGPVGALASAIYDTPDRPIVITSHS
ncbi:MAG: hypothetical protein LBC95_03030, partial [Candidatus Nomurabacteria bacterium]|nr:hypothetical protein [Candidatus Nomurabacteria bacterium]